MTPKKKPDAHEGANVDASVVRSDIVPVQPILSGTWKEMITRWLFEQSVSTVLLVAILAAIVYGVPTFILPSISSGYKENAATLKEVMVQQNESRERVIKVIMESHDRDRGAFQREMERRQ